MGVSRLWLLLSNGEKVSLESCCGQSWAVDLTGWIVHGRMACATGVSRNHLMMTTVFYRALSLMKHGIRPIFVLDGSVAPEIKQVTLQHRCYGNNKETPGSRFNLAAINSSCQELLESLGLQVIWSSGEAEKTCAYLNRHGFVDACLSDDSDVLLYGATTVFRNLDINERTVQKYTISEIEERLGLNRKDLVVMALLSGCDYGEGVKNIGPKKAHALIEDMKEYEDDILSRVLGWRNNVNLETMQGKQQELLETPKAVHCTRCHHPGTKVLHTSSGCCMCKTKYSCHIKGSVACACLYHTLENEISPYTAELAIRKKALEMESFPNHKSNGIGHHFENLLLDKLQHQHSFDESLIEQLQKKQLDTNVRIWSVEKLVDEFLSEVSEEQHKDTVKLENLTVDTGCKIDGQKTVKLKVSLPDWETLMVRGVEHLKMSEAVLMRKLVPVMLLMHLHGTICIPGVTPIRIVKTITKQRIPCFKVQWARFAPVTKPPESTQPTDTLEGLREPVLNAFDQWSILPSATHPFRQTESKTVIGRGATVRIVNPVQQKNDVDTGASACMVDPLSQTDSKPIVSSDMETKYKVKQVDSLQQHSVIGTEDTVKLVDPVEQSSDIGSGAAVKIADSLQHSSDIGTEVAIRMNPLLQSSDIGIEVPVRMNPLLQSSDIGTEVPVRMNPLLQSSDIETEVAIRMVSPLQHSSDIWAAMSSNIGTGADVIMTDPLQQTDSKALVSSDDWKDNNVYLVEVPQDLFNIKYPLLVQDFLINQATQRGKRYLHENAPQKKLGNYYSVKKARYK